MNRKNRNILLALSLTLASAFALGGCAGCKKEDGKKLEPSKEVYDYDFDVPFAEDDKVDPYMTIDGILDEDVWKEQNCNYYLHGQDGVNYKIGTHFSDVGLYIAATSTDARVVWTAPYQFDDNTGFSFAVVGIDKVNEKETGNLEATASHPTEKMLFNMDSKNIRSYNGVPVYSRVQTTDNAFTVEMFMTWEDLHFEGKQEQIRLEPWYRKVKAAGSGENKWIYPAGYDPAGAYYAMYVFDENGSISQAGTAKNTSDMTLGTSPLGFGATDRWDLSGDVSSATVRTAKSTTAKSEVVWLKNEKAKNFAFETTVTFNDEVLWPGKESKKAGILFADSNMNRRLYVTHDKVKDFRLGDRMAFTWINEGGNIATGTGSDDNTVTLRAVKYGKQLYYFYRYADDAEYTFAYVEDYDAFNDGDITVGLYASCSATFSDWEFTSYDDDVDALKADLGQYVYFVFNEYDRDHGEVTLSSSVVAKGNPNVSVSVSPKAGYKISKFEVDGENKLSDFNLNAREGVYGLSLTKDTTVTVEFAEYSESEKAQMQTVYIRINDAVGQNNVFTSADVSVYPVDSDGSYNTLSNTYFYKTLTTPKGIAVFDLPYEGSTVYPAGTYLVKIQSNAYFHYEKIITVKNEDTNSKDSLDVYETGIEVPSEMILQGSTSVTWSIDDNKTVRILPSVTGDQHAIAYYSNVIGLGEISATFTTKNSNVMLGFGYRVAGTTGTVGELGVMGVRHNGNKLEAVTYNYRSGYKQSSAAFSEASLEQLKNSGDVVDNGDGSLTYTLRLIKAGSGVFLFVGDTHVHTFTYGNEVTLTAGQTIQLGLMARTAGNLGSAQEIVVENVQKPKAYGEVKTVVKGGISNPDSGNMTVVLRGKNAFGIDVELTKSVGVGVSKSYSFEVTDLDAENALTYTIEFYQGDSAYIQEDGNPIQIQLKANEEYVLDFAFNQFKREYKETLHLAGVADPVVTVKKELTGHAISVPDTYVTETGVYRLDEGAEGSRETAVMSETENNDLVGKYVLEMEYSTMQAFDTKLVDGKVVYETKKNAQYKHLLTKDAYDYFEISATILNTSNGDSGLGFVVGQGSQTVIFYWGSWDEYKVFARIDCNWDGGQHPQAGVPANSARLTKDVPFEAKLFYADGVFTMYAKNGEEMRKYASFTVDQLNAKGGNFNANEGFRVGIGACNDNGSYGEFSDVSIRYGMQYVVEKYFANGNGGYDKTTEALQGFSGDEVAVNMDALYVLDTAQANLLSGTLIGGQSLVLKAYYKHFFEYSAVSGSNVTLSDEGGKAVYTLSGGAYKYLLSKESGNKLSNTATITSAADSGAGLGFVVGQGQNTVIFYWGDWDSNKLFARVNCVWTSDHPQKVVSPSGMQTIAQNVPLNVKLSYINGKFTLWAEKNGVMTAYASWTVEELNNAGAQFDRSKGFYVGIAGCNDAKSVGTFTNVVTSVETLKVVSYTQTTYKPDGTLLETEELQGNEGEKVFVNKAYDDGNGKIYLINDVVETGEKISETLVDGLDVNLVANLNKEAAFRYGVYSGNFKFGSSKEGNLTIDTNTSWYRYIYSERRSSNFTVTAKFTSITENCETGFSVMNDKGEKLTFRLVSWNSSGIAYVQDYSYLTTKYLDIGIGKFIEGRTVELTMSYNNGTYTFSCNGKTTTITAAQISEVNDQGKTISDFGGALRVGFLTWNDNKSGAHIELKSFQAHDSLPTVQDVDYLFLGDSWIDVAYWKSFNSEFVGKTAYNLGYGGAEVPYWEAQVGDLKRIVNPDKIVIHIGINDILNKGMTADEVASSIQALMANLKQAFPTTDIYWLSISPTNDGNRWERCWQTAKPTNEQMKAFAETDEKYHYIDFASALCNAVGQSYATTTGGAAFVSHYGGDGLHLNDTGYALFVATIKEAIGYRA